MLSMKPPLTTADVRQGGNRQRGAARENKQAVEDETLENSNMFWKLFSSQRHATSPAPHASDKSDVFTSESQLRIL